ncbi:MAG: hypothetical protein AAF975_08235, partial [Spirochaetota bacterium]
KITEKQVTLVRKRFIRIISIYQKIFIAQIPCPMQEVSKRIENIDPKHAEHWLRDIRMLGLAMTLFTQHVEKNNSYILALEYLYKFAGIFRNSILCKNLRIQLGTDNHLASIRREQIAIFHQYADDLIARQRAFFVRNQSLTILENAIRVTRALIELGFVTENEFFSTEFYKKQEDALTKILIDGREAARK